MSAAPVAGVSTGGISRAPLRETLKARGSACTSPDQLKPTTQTPTMNAKRVTAKFIFASCNGDLKKISPIIRDREAAPTRSLKLGWRFPLCRGRAGHVILDARECGD